MVTLTGPILSDKVRDLREFVEKLVDDELITVDDNPNGDGAPDFFIVLHFSGAGFERRARAFLTRLAEDL